METPLESIAIMQLCCDKEIGCQSMLEFDDAVTMMLAFVCLSAALVLYCLKSMNQTLCLDLTLINDQSTLSVEMH